MATSKIQRLRARLANVREEGKAVVERTMTVAEVNAGVGLMAYMRGRMGDDNDNLDVGGVPVGLTAGLVASGIGISGMLDDYSSHLTAFGSGMVGEYVSHSLFKLGKEAKLKAAASVSGRPARQVADGKRWGRSVANQARVAA